MAKETEKKEQQEIKQEKESAEKETPEKEQSEQKDTAAKDAPIENKKEETPARDKEATSKEEQKETTEEKTAESTPKEAEASGESKEAAPEKKEEATAEKKEAAKAKETSTNNVPEEDDHEDFDWSQSRSDVTERYTEEEREELAELYDSTLQTVNENEIVTGRVVGLTNSDAVLNIGFKSDGLVPLSEFRDVEELNEGDEVEVYVVEKEDEKGQLVLSRKNAKLLRAWQKIVDAHENDKVVTGEIISKTKGGLIVNIGGLETFLPGSQIDVKPIVDYDAFVGKKMEFKVVKVNEAIKNAVVSHKALIESDLEDQRQEIISKLDEGQVLEGTVKNLTDFGAFIDLGGVDGLLYITDISWGRIDHPSEVLEINQKLNVVVLSFDDEKKRISLGLKQLQPHPWDVLDEKIDVGAKVEGKVVNIEDYGAFLEITPGVEGLVHVSEVSWSNQPINAKDYFKIGDTHEAIVMTIDREERKMSLSIKRLEPDPWEKVKEKYSEGTKHKGEVQNITPYGVFLEFEEGIGGMIHISDLSWTKRYSHPSEFTSVGEELEVVILEVDMEERKLTLGHKQLEEDPWDTFETVFPEGTVHEGTIIKREDKGGIVLLPYGLEGFAPNRHLKKENGKLAEVDEKLNFKVIEFDRRDKKIILSHTKYLEDQQGTDVKVEPAKEPSKKRKGKGGKKAAPKPKMEKTTLGDLEALSNLKQEMEKEETGKKTKSKKAEEKKAKKDTEEAKKKEDDKKEEEKKESKASEESKKAEEKEEKSEKKSEDKDDKK